MATETERKFLLKDESWRASVSERHHLSQGYAHFWHAPHQSFRVRIADDLAFLTIKGPVHGFSRSEFEYSIPLADARELLHDFCESGCIEKYRNIVIYSGLRWEIDEFLGDNAGLIVAEIELDSENALFERPPWLGEEVTGNVHYYNSNLRKYPYKKWNKGMP